VGRKAPRQEEARWGRRSHLGGPRKSEGSRKSRGWVSETRWARKTVFSNRAQMGRGADSHVKSHSFCACGVRRRTRSNLRSKKKRGGADTGCGAAKIGWASMRRTFTGFNIKNGRYVLQTVKRKKVTNAKKKRSRAGYCFGKWDARLKTKKRSTWTGKHPRVLGVASLHLGPAWRKYLGLKVHQF